MNTLLPNEKELRALRLFVSDDATRQHLATLWRFESDGGVTYVATDGHTEVVRRAGTHRTMPMHEIAKLTPLAVDDKGEAFETVTRPPAWDSVFRPSLGKKLADRYGINPSYVARAGDVERAAGIRAADDFQPAPRMSLKEAKAKKASLKNSAMSVWTIPSDPLEPWLFRVDADAALWEGLIMPRRL